jgi:hypothetical protein
MNMACYCVDYSFILIIKIWHKHTNFDFVDCISPIELEIKDIKGTVRTWQWLPVKKDALRQKRWIQLKKLKLYNGCLRSRGIPSRHWHPLLIYA